MKDEVESTALLLLAGGRSSRMGGVNKAFVPFGETTLVENVLSRVRGVFSERWVSANRDEERFEKLGLRVLRDVRAGFPGPLGGVEALACVGTNARWVLTVPCDTPFLPMDLLERFHGALRTDRALGKERRAYVAYAGGRLQSTVALLSQEALQSAAPFLDAGERKLGLWFEKIGAGVVRWDDVSQKAFENINTPEDCLKWNQT